MNIILTIIMGLILLGMIGILVFMFNLLNSFGELLVRFVEQNQEHFKNQKHLVAKSADLAQSLKKAPNLISNLKAVSRKFDHISVKMDQETTKIGSKIGSKLGK